MIRTLPICLAIILFLTAPACAQESPAEWIRKLGSGSYVERERAAKKLEKQGKAALPLLRDAIAVADLETKRRALLLMERIEDQVLLDQLVTATPTCFRVKDAPVNDVLRDFEPHFGLRCGNAIPNDRIERVDTGELPFWQAWSRFCKAAKLEESDYARSAAKLFLMPHWIDEQGRDMIRAFEGNKDAVRFPRIEFAKKMESSQYVADDRHSVRVLARWLMTDRAIDKMVPHAVLVFEVRPEPRLEIAKTPRVELTKYVDAKGKEKVIQVTEIIPALRPPGDTEFLSAFVGEVQFGGLLHLKAIPWSTSSGHWRELHGNIQLDVSVRPALLEIANVPSAAGKTVRGYGGIAIKVIEIDTSDEGDLVLHVHLDHLDTLTPQTPEQKFIRVRPGLIAERGAIDVAMERLELRDSRGNAYRRVKAQYQQIRGGKGYDVELHFAAKVRGNDEASLVLTKAPRNIALTVPFVVRDLMWEDAKK